MHRIYQNSFLFALLFLFSQHVNAQNDTTSPVSVDPQLQDIYNTKVPKQYKIAGITVTGAKSFDQNLIISISGLAVGDKIQIPGTDVFSKAISKLWKQSLVSDVQLNLTRLQGSDLYVEIEIKERPRLIDFKITGVKKGQRDDLEGKSGLVKDRVLTENMKLSAVEAMRKFYYDKGYRNVNIEMTESPAPGTPNAVNLLFHVTKGIK